MARATLSRKPGPPSQGLSRGGPRYVHALGPRLVRREQQRARRHRAAARPAARRVVRRRRPAPPVRHPQLRPPHRGRHLRRGRRSARPPRVRQGAVRPGGQGTRRGRRRLARLGRRGRRHHRRRGSGSAGPSVDGHRVRPDGFDLTWKQIGISELREDPSLPVLPAVDQRPGRAPVARRARRTSRPSPASSPATATASASGSAARSTRRSTARTSSGSTPRSPAWWPCTSAPPTATSSASTRRRPWSRGTAPSSCAPTASRCAPSRRDDLPAYHALNADPEVYRWLGGSPLTREHSDAIAAVGERVLGDRAARAPRRRPHRRPAVPGHVRPPPSGERTGRGRDRLAAAPRSTGGRATRPRRRPHGRRTASTSCTSPA